MPQVALVGCAHIHVPGFVQRLMDREDVQVLAVWDPDPRRAARWAAALDAPAPTHVASIWENPGVEGVIIAAETYRHQELVVQAAQAGKHLFVEKPLGLGAEDARRMAQAVDQAGVLFQTGFVQRGLPAYRFLREQIQAGTFGQVTRMRVCVAHDAALRDLFTPDWLWMTDPVQAGMGAFGDLGIHGLDLLMWMLGEVERVTAALAVAVERYGPRCDELGEGLLRFRSGALATLAASWVDHAAPITAELWGTEGHAYVLGRREVFVRSEHLAHADGSTPWPDLPPAWPHALELFLDALAGRDVPLVGVWEAAQRSAVMEALYRAAQEGTWVAVDR